MKSKILKKIISVLAGFLLFFTFLGFPYYQVGVHAAGDLEITHNALPLPSPVFSVVNFLPGDMDDKDIDVKNNGTVPHFISVRGVRTGGVGDDPKLETILEIVISKGLIELYGGSLGAKTVQEFFDDSMNPNGVPLSAVAPTETNTYNFKVTFPVSAGNEFENKSVLFDLIFGEPSSDHIVINEVYYDVDPDHGLDSPKDRGFLHIGRRNATIIIKDNGAGSINTATILIKDICKIVQQNQSNINNAVQIYSNTGNNDANNSGSNINITSGDSNVFVNIVNNVIQNNFGSCNRKKLGQNQEWVELYNPTDETVN